MAKKETWKAQVLNKALMCVDRATDPNLARELRHLRRSIEEKDKLDKQCGQEMLSLLSELQAILNQNKPQVASVYVSRLRELVNGNAETRKRGGIMGLFDKLKNKIAGGEKKSEDNLLRDKAREAEEQVFALEKRIAEESEKRAKLLEQMKDHVNTCATVEPDSYEYMIARERAKALKPQIDGVEKTINMYIRQLQSSARYQAMVSSGRATLNLQEMMPDPNEAVALLEMITERMQTISEGMQDFDAAIAKSQAAFDKAVGVNAMEEDDEFDRMVAAQRKENAKRAEAEKAAEDAAKKAAEEARKAEEEALAKAKAEEESEIDRMIAAAKQATEEAAQSTAEEAGANEAGSDDQEVCL